MDSFGNVKNQIENGVYVVAWLYLLDCIYLKLFES